MNKFKFFITCVIVSAGLILWAGENRPEDKDAVKIDGKVTEVLANSALESLPGALRIACVGDSITYGYGVELREKNCYPAKLQQLLGPAYQVANFGCSGSTLMKGGNSPYWRQQEFKDAIAFNPQIVIIMLGTNDAKKNNWEKRENFSADYKDLIQTFQKLSSSPKVMIALTAPAMNGAGFEISPASVQEQLPLIRDIGRNLKIPLIDLNSPLLGHSELFLTDGVHPNSKGDEIIAKTVYKALQDEGMLKNRPAKLNVQKQTDVSFSKTAGFRDGNLDGQNQWMAKEPFKVSAADGFLCVAGVPANASAILNIRSEPVLAEQPMLQVASDFSFTVGTNEALKGYGPIFSVQISRTPDAQDPVRLQLIRWDGGKPKGNLYTLQLSYANGGTIQSRFIPGELLGLGNAMSSHQLQLRLALYRQPNSPKWIASGYLVNLTKESPVTSLQNQTIASTDAFHTAPGWYGGINNGGPFGIAELKVKVFSMRVGGWNEAEVK